MKQGKKCIVMFSGGLDSRLIIKIMQKQGFEIFALFFKVPFGACSNEKEVIGFSEIQKVNLKIFDCTRGKLLQEYLEVIKKAEHGTGAGMNPCIDCRIFMLKKAKEFADEKGINLIVTGEVLDERPMSQKKRTMDLVEEESNLKGRLLRPLSAKLLSETEAEKKGFVNRSELYDIHGRRREMQIKLARKFKIKYPSPAGGCLLCEKNLKKRFKYLLDRGINEDEIKLIGIGRHFLIDDCWVVIGRDETENKIIELVGKSYTLILPKFAGPSVVIFDEDNKKVREKVGELIKAYSKEGSLEERKKFEEFKV
jgi:predicted subunit of tRNA(5-methylaminomethyl-2-thiouridylate) methyltransferase